MMIKVEKKKRQDLRKAVRAKSGPPRRGLGFYEQ